MTALTVADAVRVLEGTLLAGAGEAARAVRGGYVSDLLSDVMANAEAGYLWVTLQKHDNIVAVAHLKDLAAIVLTGGRQPDPGVLARAQEEHVPIIGTSLTAWEAVGRLHALGLQ